MASYEIRLRVVSLPSTDITFTPAAASFTAPVPAGALIGSFSVSPDTWAGEVVVGGVDADKVSVSNSFELRAAVALTEAREYVITLTSSP